LTWTGGSVDGRALVIGYGISGRAAARWLVSQGLEVVVLEDDPEAGRAAQMAEADGLANVALEVGRGAETAAALARGVDLVVPSPGVPVGHPALAAAFEAGTEVVSEIELAWRVLDAARRDRGERYSLLAITGTNGKTTVTQLVTAMLSCSGHNAIAAGNVGFPLLEATSHLIPGQEAVLVAEVSSFQLEHTRQFRPDVSCWLNFAPDHLDWHPSLGHYRRAKAKIWAHQGPGCVAVFNRDDDVVREEAASLPRGVQAVTFGVAGPDIDTTPGVHTASGNVGPTRAPAALVWSMSRGSIIGPDGFVFDGFELPRSLPHDLSNTAAALAVAMAGGASGEACREAARTTVVPPHRVQLVGERDGVAWYDDSKATTPAAVRAGVRGFPSVVLIAGGRNKGLDLSELATTVPPVRAVVAVGESAHEVAKAFAGLAPVRQAGSMIEAVDAASSLAVSGDTVVLSPGCASFDWYSSYIERGEVFSGLVRCKLGSGPDKAKDGGAG
jgi:UDP-N-acetylmuramoylalanine--D-glutamate ligase